MTPLPWRRVSVTVAMLSVLAAAAGLVAVRPASAASHEVRITDSTFATAVLVVQVGDTVTWINADDRPHTVTSTDGSFDSGNVDEGVAYSFTFTEPGTYTYLCEYHPDMRATVVVEAASAPAPTEAPAATPAPADDGASGTPDAGHAAHDGSAGADQPDTAMPAPRSVPPISFLMWGAALIVVGLAFAPPLRSRPTEVLVRPQGGWRR